SCLPAPPRFSVTLQPETSSLPAAKAPLIRAYVSRPGRVDQVLVGPFACVLIEAPALDLPEDLVELLARERLVDEALAPGEPLEVPFAALELGRNRVLPQRQVFLQVALQRAFGAVERSQIAVHRRRRHARRRPPDGAE